MLVYGVVAVLHLLWASAPPDASVVSTKFSLHMTGWALPFTLMAYLCNRAAKNHVPSICFALLGSAGLFLFAGSVLVGLNGYDGVGAVRDPAVRWPVYSGETTLAFLSVVLDALALNASCLLSRLPTRTMQARTRSTRSPSGRTA
jgi:hypothetical protein